jgi:hypothetical protein
MNMPPSSPAASLRRPNRSVPSTPYGVIFFAANEVGIGKPYPVRSANHNFGNAADNGTTDGCLGHEAEV